MAFFVAAGSGADLDIDVEGNEAFGNRAIRGELPPRPEQITRESVRFWQNDAVFFVREFYYDHGFFDASVSATREQTGAEQWTVRVRIDEGEQYVYDTVRVITPDTTLAIVNMQRLNARPGEPFRGRDILKDRQNIIRQFGNRGFLHPAITDSVMFHDDRKTISVRYFVKPSYQALFDTLIIRRFRARADSLAGLTQIDLLRSLVPYDRGDTITARQNDNVIEKLQSTGVFTYVRFKDTLLSETGRTGLILIAEERAPGNLRASLFYETQYGPGVSGRIRHRNIGGSLDEARFSALLALDKQNVTAGYGSPLTFGYLLRFDADLDFNWFQDAEVHDTLGVELFGGDFEGSATARFSRTITEWSRAITSAEVLGERRYAAVDSSSFGVSLNFISTVFFTFVDRIIDPRRGSRYALTFGNGGPLYENDQFRFLSSRHNWLEMETAYYTMLIDQLQLAGRIDGGAFVNDGGLNSDRFFLGGPRDIRAFGFRDVCPAGVGDICGEAPELRPAYYLASAEIRFAPFDFGYIPSDSFLSFVIPLQVVPFVDFGQVWDLNDSFVPPWRGAGQAIAYGAGLRYPLFGVFNLRLDFAWGQSWAPRQDAFSFVIDLAQAF
jgi:outer membrane protein assembly factor BamA